MLISVTLSLAANWLGHDAD